MDTNSPCKDLLFPRGPTLAQKPLNLVGTVLKYINTKNVVTHSENCKVEIPLDITAQQLSKKIYRMTDIYEASKKRGFDTYSESDSDTDRGDENEHADQTVMRRSCNLHVLAKASPKFD